MHARPLIFAAPLAMLSIACQSEQPKKPERIDRATWESPHTGLVGHNQPVAVVEGPPPVIYQAMVPGPVHVSDSTTGAVIASGMARQLDYVRVDARGVYIGETRIANGPLPADHHYTIYVDPQTKQ
ncbi:MAG TPA: hypothetical protein VH370_01950 [Humisphaera sp.]|jgi:hypothetical protein|nr:hypothetical protein [Humisphaera sp.]